MVNDRESPVASIADVRRTLIGQTTERFREIWLTIADGPSLCALMNGNVGWLMYLRENGDAGFSSRNPRYEGSPSAMLEYYLSNGQRDVYPASWALDEEEIVRALEYFVEHRDRPPFVLWHDDSQG